MPTDKNPTHHIALHSITDLKSLRAVTRAMKKLYPDLSGVVISVPLFHKLFSDGYSNAHVDSCFIWQGAVDAPILYWKDQAPYHPAKENVQKWIKDHPDYLRGSTNEQVSNQTGALLGETTNVVQDRDNG